MKHVFISILLFISSSAWASGKMYKIQAQGDTIFPNTVTVQRDNANKIINVQLSVASRDSADILHVVSVLDTLSAKSQSSMTNQHASIPNQSRQLQTTFWLKPGEAMRMYGIESGIPFEQIRSIPWIFQLPTGKLQVVDHCRVVLASDSLRVILPTGQLAQYRVVK